MREQNLGPKLHQMCEVVGVTWTNIMYSFRRKALKEARWHPEGGTKLAKELAGHVPQGQSLWAYDTDGLSAIDITAFRLREDAGRSPTEVAEMFSQARTSVYHSVDGAGSSLVAALYARVDQRVGSDPEYLRLEQVLRVSF
jgi:hypothetical protein